jgi:predicted porin
MKKSLLALAVLGAYAGGAAAQSSVTLYGTLDLNGRFVKADGQNDRYSMGQDGINSSQLGIRGVEDLGGGLRAGFTLLSGINADSGNANAKFWNRRSTVSLFGGWGELRLGRDYIPTFWNQTIFDAFGTNGLGSSTNVRQLYGGTRSDNSIGYFLPANLGGFYGQFMAAAAENGGTLERPARYLGGRLGFAAGPFDVALSASQQRYSPANGTAFVLNGPVATQGIVNGGALLAGAIAAGPGDEQDTWNVGGSWDFGFFKVLGYYNEDKIKSAKEKNASISGVIPFGQAEVHVGYDVSEYKNGSVSTKLDQIKGTFQYNLSKRTAVYTTASMLKNKDATRYQIPGGIPQGQGPLPTAGGDSQGIEFGLRHFF